MSKNTDYIMGVDRYGSPYTARDALGNYGRPGYILVGAVSRTSWPRVWIKDSGAAINYNQPVYKKVSVKDLKDLSSYDPWAKVKAEAHRKLQSGYWGGARNTWQDFSYFEVLKNQKKPGYRLIRRENGGDSSDVFRDKGNGTFRTDGRQYYWIPKTAVRVDPTNGQYIGADGNRYFFDGRRWTPNDSGGFSRKELNKAVTTAAVVVGGGALVGSAIGYSYLAATSAGAAGASGAVVGAPIPAAPAIIATPLSAGAAAATGSAGATAGTVTAGTVAAGTFASEAIDFLKDTGKALVTGEVIKRSSGNTPSLPDVSDYSGQPVSRNVVRSDTIFNPKSLLALVTITAGLFSVLG